MSGASYRSSPAFARGGVGRIESVCIYETVIAIDERSHITARLIADAVRNLPWKIADIAARVGRIRSGVLLTICVQRVHAHYAGREVPFQ